MWQDRVIRDFSCNRERTNTCCRSHCCPSDSCLIIKIMPVLSTPAPQVANTLEPWCPRRGCLSGPTSDALGLTSLLGQPLLQHPVPRTLWPAPWSPSPPPRSPMAPACLLRASLEAHAWVSLGVSSQPTPCDPKMEGSGCPTRANVWSGRVWSQSTNASLFPALAGRSEKHPVWLHRQSQWRNQLAPSPGGRGDTSFLHGRPFPVFLPDPHCLCPCPWGLLSPVECPA